MSVNACRIEEADPSLLGEAHPAAIKFCGPYMHANGAGWWLYPPVDINVKFDGKSWYSQSLSDYGHSDGDMVIECAKRYGGGCIVEHPNGSWGMGKYLGTSKLKLNFGQVEPDIMQIWTGLVFKTPPGWGLWITDPINIATNYPFRVQNGIVETSWLRADHWINLKFNRLNQEVFFRKTQKYPIAQIIPVPLSTYDKNSWETETHEGMLKNKKEFLEWSDYYRQKFVDKEPEKDSTTYHKNRKQKNSQCPYHQS